VMTASAGSAPDTVTSTSPALTYRARVDDVSTTRSPPADDTRVRTPASTGRPAAADVALVEPPFAALSSPDDELHADAKSNATPRHEAPVRRIALVARITDRRAPSRSR
jgi:hypothetical protein